MDSFCFQTLPIVSAVNSSSKAPNEQPISFPRPIPNFHPSVWGNHFLKYSSSSSSSSDDDDQGNSKSSSTNEEEEEIEHARLKEEIRKELIMGISSDKSWQKIELIDKIQRLGLSYHYETEIEKSLSNIYDDDFTAFYNKDDDNLYLVSLRFRLLRQTGRFVSCDRMFKKFMNEEGNLQESKVKGLKEILSLYEASNLRVDEENFLEEAFTFTSSKLESMVTNNDLSHFDAIQVKQALKHPIQKGLPRLRALQYIPIYQEDESHNLSLLDFAKLDFNRLQKMHQIELSKITEWWKEIDFATNFPFARDRLVECYFWALGVYFEPQYSLGRSFLTKVTAMASIMDDMYDSYATLEELTSFTTAIQRWNMDVIDKLPIYMRHLYHTMLNVYAKMEEELDKIGKPYIINYPKEEMKKLSQAYFQEAYWCKNSHVPTFKEGMEVLLVSSGYLLLLTATMAGMGNSTTKEFYDWVSNNPPIVRAALIISRLSDDIVGYENEMARGDVTLSVECYMKEFEVSKEDAKNELSKVVKNAWKNINRELLKETNSISMPVLERILNLARVIDVLYKEEDGYTNSSTNTKDLLTNILVHPVQ